MDYKEKYEQALERMKSWARGEHPECFSEAQKAAEFIFPELKDKESKDEQIRKAIHIYLDWLDGRKDCQPKGIYSIRDMIAWLEKQGKQEQDPCEHCRDKGLYCHNFPCIEKRLFKQGKQMDAELGQSEVIKVSEQKFEPKFHPGDWIVDTKTPNDVFCVIGMLGKAYKVIDTDGVEYRIPHCKVDKQFHLLTMITEDYCSSKVAKLLKEKGFNVPVWTRYEDNKDKDVFFGDKYDWNNSPIGQTSAPTHQMALKWLREVYKISIEVFACCDKNKDGKIWSYTICKIYDAANEIGPSISYHKTYEEAIEAALIYCLKNLL